MIDLPVSNKLPFDRLAACFSDVTNSYKFFWFLAILKSIRENHTSIIPINNLLAHMVASVWYPTNYFHLSFGRQDRLSQIALQIRANNDLAVDVKHDKVVEITLSHLLKKTTRASEIKSLSRFVPYRFLRPFFSQQLRGKPDWQINRLIVGMAEESFYSETAACLYRFVRTPVDAIEIQAEWFRYLKKHLEILTGFCLWHLLNYLQNNNPSVPNIAGKLFEPEKRDPKLARSFWCFVFDQMESIQCIYSDQTIKKGEFSLDHFLPWSFVAHDLLWNIIPTVKNVNSAKGDRLPNIKLYFESFAKLQYKAFQIIAAPNKVRLLEDYTLLFKEDSIGGLKSLPFARFRDTLHDTIMPQIQIAKNMGFVANWSYIVP